nr:ROK family protein [bacterium]
MLYLGVDVGGSHIGVGLVDEHGTILHQDEMVTNPKRGTAAVLDELAQLARRVAEKAGGMDKIQGMGIGLPGVVNVDAGTLVFADNLGWSNVHICSEMNARLGIPIMCGNDANVAALAEAKAGACMGADNAIVLTLGTGLGGGIILGGKIHTGAHFVGGEIGHMVIEVGGRLCNCGTRGCWERYAAATALINAGRQAIEEDPNGAIAKAAGGNPDKVNARIVVDAAKAGDAQALAIWKDYIEYLCIGMVSLVNLLDPQVFVIGGGVSAAGDFLLDAVRTRLHEMLSFRDCPHATVELAKLGNNAGIIGAAMLCVQ